MRARSYQRIFRSFSHWIIRHCSRYESRKCIPGVPWGLGMPAFAKPIFIRLESRGLSFGGLHLNATHGFHKCLPPLPDQGDVFGSPSGVEFLRKHRRTIACANRSSEPVKVDPSEPLAVQIINSGPIGGSVAVVEDDDSVIAKVGRGNTGAPDALHPIIHDDVEAFRRVLFDGAVIR